MHSFVRAKVFGFIATRCTYALTGMGASERAWAVTMMIKSSTCNSLTGLRVEKLLTSFTSDKLNKVRMHCRETEKLNYVNAGTLWRDKDELFNLKLDTFGVDPHTINDTPTCPKRVVCCWIKKTGGISAER